MQEVDGLDEDFFLYHEEVAFSRVAQRKGWRVEFDPSVRVVHRHPLQNRPISPKMRVITRHSKLLYFRKHLPRWQFRTLVAIVRVEAAVSGRWAALRARADESRAWAVIDEVARRLLAGRSVRGSDVRTLADTVARGESGVRPADPSDPIRHPAWRQRGAGRVVDTPLGIRKDGPA
jgi:GT2 family glycosyltransferase